VRQLVSRFLIVFSTVDGHTQKICERIQGTLEAQGHFVTLAEVSEALSMDSSAFDRIVIGASIRYGRHRPAVFDFIDRHLATLQRLPSAFFSVNVVARKPGKDTPEGNPYVRKFLRQSPWTPTVLAAFAGRIEYARYRLVDRLMIQFIMWITRGPTDPRTSVEFTDWPAVETFVGRLANM
jgi:menaquinone-dependent protoporphyrinogen oxidase